MSENEDRFEPLEEDQEWDGELAQDLIGSTLFVGITHFDHEGNLIEKEQVFGVVKSVEPRSGIKLIQSDGALYVLAPVLDAIEAGDPDFYQLSEAHEPVENPDFVMFVTATRPPPELSCQFSTLLFAFHPLPAVRLTNSGRHKRTVGSRPNSGRTATRIR